MNRTFNLTTTKFLDINAFHVSGSFGLASCVGGWRVCVVMVCGSDGCGQLDGCGRFWSVCSCGMSVVLGGVWLMGVDGYGVWVVVESVWLEGYGWSQGCN